MPKRPVVCEFLPVTEHSRQVAPRRVLDAPEDAPGAASEYNASDEAADRPCLAGVRRPRRVEPTGLGTLGLLGHPQPPLAFDREELGPVICGDGVGVAGRSHPDEVRLCCCPGDRVGRLFEQHVVVVFPLKQVEILDEPPEFSEGL